jgi:hypothetical protein
MSVGKNKKLSKGRKGGKKKLCVPCRRARLRHAPPPQRSAQSCGCRRLPLPSVSPRPAHRGGRDRSAGEEGGA